ncbi:MAG: ATPase, partial [Gammaproteobacteria bacterium]
MSKAVIQWIGGPVLKARVKAPFHIHEAVAVGEQRLLGEVIQLSGDVITAQVYEDTTGLRPGDPVTGTGLPLSVALGPGILGRIFDGLLRPLGDVSEHWFKPGLGSKRHGSFAFTPSVAEGDELNGGQVFGEVAGQGPGRACLVPPDVSGRVVSVAEAGEYAEDETVLVLEDAEGRERQLSMQHDWPVRHPRPAAGRLPADAPMVTGQRILDTL